MSSNDYVRIESADGYTFVVARNVACASGMLKTSLDTEKGFGESSSGVCKLEERGVIVAKVIEYLSYKVQYADFNAADIKDDFTDRIDPYIALELLTAADYLEV